jgi:hypothetical protein
LVTSDLDRTKEDLQVGWGSSKARIRSEVLVRHGDARTTVHGREPIVAGS